MDQVNGVIPGVLVGVPGEEDERDVAHSFAGARVLVLGQAPRGIATEQNLGKELVGR